jgi:hypothetical protein
MNEIIDLERDQRSLKNLGHLSYLLHTIVAVGAVLPGVQASVALLLVAFALDMFKKDDAAGAGRHAAHQRSEHRRRGGEDAFLIGGAAA